MSGNQVPTPAGWQTQTNMQHINQTTEFVVQLNHRLLNVICLCCEVRVHPVVMWCMHASCDEEHSCFDDYCWTHEWWAMTTWWTMIMAEWMKTWCFWLEWFGKRVSVWTHQCSDAVLFLHLLFELFETRLQTLVKRSKGLRHLLAVDTNSFSQVRDLNEMRTHTQSKDVMPQRYRAPIMLF